MVQRHLIRMSALGALLCVGLVYAAYVLAETAQEWQSAVELRDPHPLAVNRLRHQLGYGGLVHNYLNAVLRPDRVAIYGDRFDMGGINAVMEEFESFDVSPLERTALNIVSEELHNLRDDMARMMDGTTQGMTPEEVFAARTVDLTRLARAVDILASISFGNLGDDPPRHQLTAEFESAIGLDGVVQHTKELLLTGELRHADQADEASLRAQALLDRLGADASSNTEREAVAVMGRTAADYSAGVARAREMIAQGKSASEIDEAIRVDDAPAISAFATLLSYDVARLARGTEAVSDGLFTARVIVIGLIMVFLLPFLLQVVRVCVGIMKAAPEWADRLGEMAQSMAKEEFEKAQDYSGLPKELAALEEPFAAIRRTLWFRKEQAVEGEAQVDSIASENEQLSTKIKGAREDLRAATRRAELAEAEAAKAGKDVDMMGGVIEAMSHGVLATRGFDSILFWNLRLSELLGIPADWFSRDRSLHELVLYLATRGDFGTGDPMETVQQVVSVLGDKLSEGVFRYDVALKDDRVLAFEIVRRGDGTIVFSATDITERHEQAVAMEQQAISDPLTGLANRTALNDFAGSMLKHARRSGETAAILGLDLDGFKPINDRHGHGAGDEVLVELSRRLTEEARETDFVARTGGDEFVLVLLHLEDGDGAVRFANRLLRAIEVPIRLANGTEVSVSGSIGISLFPEDAEDLDVLYRKADEALYAAKAAGRNCVKTYAEAIAPPGDAEIAQPA